ncbi:MAG: endonuclease/exonuclease/phosphatase family protein [Gemmatimonadota bacterium]|nr:endonuclease/exonuclease/phosphatase family protein [Gemmatimonadota bacterium]
MSRPGRLACGLVPIACAVAGCAASTGSSPGTGTPGPDGEPGVAIVIDGWPADWGRDATGEPGTVAVRDDAGAIYLSLALASPRNIQGLEGALLVVLDADGDPSSGASAFGVEGADLVLSFTMWRGPGRADDGTTWWRPDPADPERVVPPRTSGDPDAIGLWFEPRHTSAWVELRLARRGPDPDWWSGAAFGGRLVAVDRDGRVTPASDVFRHTLETTAADAPVASGDPARATGTDFRLVSWNVSRVRVATDPAPARRILAALSPDLVLLDEVPPNLGPDDMLAILPGGREAGWNVHVGTSGSRQRGAIAFRGDVVPAPEFARVPYPAGVPDLDPGSTEPGIAEVALNMAGSGVPVTGAWVDPGGQPFLAVTLDLVCCGNSATSIQDTIRRLEAQAINRAARAALAAGPPRGGGAPHVIVGGDFNLVGSRRPLADLAAGLGSEGSALSSVYALQLDGRSSATWESSGVPFPPGQLDYVLHTAGALRVRRAFVFEARDVEAGRRRSLGLREDDSDRASDHRPIVVDFAVVPP